MQHNFLFSYTDPDYPFCPTAISDIYGSYFAVDTDGSGIDPDEKTPLSSFNGIHIGTSQATGNYHSGPIDGTENPNIDIPWTFFGVTGMQQTTSPVSVSGGSGDNYTLDFSGWNWNINRNGIPNFMAPVSDTTIVCDTGSSCSDISSYTLDGQFHVDEGPFTTVSYVLHLEGQVSSIPLPATLWLFGSGLLGPGRHSETAICKVPTEAKRGISTNCDKPGAAKKSTSS